jgi:transposase
MRKYEIKSHGAVAKWERIYLEEGAEGLYIERRGRACSAGGVSKGRAPKFDKKVEEDLIAENQRLRMELDYLKKLNALVQERQLQEKKRK